MSKSFHSVSVKWCITRKTNSFSYTTCCTVKERYCMFDTIYNPVWWFSATLNWCSALDLLPTAARQIPGFIRSAKHYTTACVRSFNKSDLSDISLFLSLEWINYGRYGIFLLHSNYCNCDLSTAHSVYVHHTRIGDSGTDADWRCGNDKRTSLSLSVSTLHKHTHTYERSVLLWDKELTWQRPYEYFHTHLHQSFLSDLLNNTNTPTSGRNSVFASALLQNWCDEGSNVRLWEWTPFNSRFHANSEERERWQRFQEEQH